MLRKSRIKQELYPDWDNPSIHWLHLKGSKLLFSKSDKEPENEFILYKL